MLADGAVLLFCDGQPERPLAQVMNEASADTTNYEGWCTLLIALCDLIAVCVGDHPSTAGAVRDVGMPCL